MNDIIGKTVAGVEVQQWAGTDTFKDTVTWERTVITFTDETTTSFDSWDGEVYDAYLVVFDDDGQPHRLVSETTACRHCGHGIGHDPVEGWVAPDAGFDVEGGDGMWRDVCPDRDDEPNPPHEPEGQKTCTYCGQHIKRGTGGLLVDMRTEDWWCRANPSNGGDAAPHEESN